MKRIEKLIVCSCAVLLLSLPIVRIQLAFAGELQITDVKLCLKVDENRNPVSVASQFPPDTKNVYAWFAWKDASEKQQITAKWHYTSEDIHILDSPVTLTRRSDQGVLSLKMGSRKTLPPGEYRLDIEVDGKVIKSATFSVLRKS